MPKTLLEVFSEGEEPKMEKLLNDNLDRAIWQVLCLAMPSPQRQADHELLVPRIKALVEREIADEKLEKEALRHAGIETID